MIALVTYVLIVTSNCIDPKASADLAIVLMQEGLCHIFLVGKR